MSAKDQTQTINVGLVVTISDNEAEVDVTVPFVHDFEGEAVWVYIDKKEAIKALDLEKHVEDIPTWWEQPSNGSDLIRRSDVLDLLRRDRHESLQDRLPGV